jgi:hypothetical protein
MTSLRYDTLWKDPTRFFQLNTLVSDTKTMLVQHLLDTDEEISYEMIEKFDRFCLKYFEGKENENEFSLEEIVPFLPCEEIDKIIPTTEYNLLHLVVRRGDLSSVQLLLHHHANASYPDLKQGNISLHFACMKGDAKIAILLLDANASPNYQNLFGKSSLHYCCEVGEEECVRVLLREKRVPINLNLRDQNGNTPLHLACIDGHLMNVQQLLIAGCDVTIRNNDQKTALDVVMMMAQRDAIRRELESHSSHTGGGGFDAEAVRVNVTAGGCDMFDGLEIKESHGHQQREDLFSGLKVASKTSSASTSPVELPPPVHLTKTYLHNKFSNPTALTLKPSVPTGRWVVMQSNRLVMDDSSAKLIIHRNR